MGEQKETQRQTEPRLIKNISAQTKRQRTGAVEGSPGEPCPQAEGTCARSVEEVGAARPVGMGRIYSKTSRRHRLVPEGARRTDLLGVHRGEAGRGGASNGRRRAWLLAFLKKKRSSHHGAVG